ncbi:hypothetical protein [Ramlibacter albus]|uniref:Uncharacterized protein n=1 Tax=Ramlibacter albus TaxID=2079448 RepID=A0A923MEX8_9BURK|nr:hypothetical protein [Ramlibacter albus]MBC5768268.1 hypothetical protein [Ramlibacter albus]
MLSHNKSNTETRTMSMLQRIPVILAVTAASYGLTLNVQSPPQKASAQQQATRR